MCQLKGVFKPLKRYFIVGRTSKIYHPFIYCPKPAMIHIRCCDVKWKDKFNSPRYEDPPYIWVYLFGFNIIWYWELPNHMKLLYPKYNIDDYWEQALWYLYYYKNISYGRLDSPDIKKAEESWPWVDCETKKSSWNKGYVFNI